MCSAYMSEGKKKLPILTCTWSIFENVKLSGMVFTLESSDMSFLSAPGSYSWCCNHSAKNMRFVKNKEKALICFPQHHFSDLKRAKEVQIDILFAGTQKIPGG